MRRRKLRCDSASLPSLPTWAAPPRNTSHPTSSSPPRGYFFIDLLSVLPLDEIALACAGLNGSDYTKNPTEAYYLSLLRLVALVRQRRHALSCAGRAAALSAWPAPGLAVRLRPLQCCARPHLTQHTPDPAVSPPAQLRCYRIFWFFSFLTYSLATPLLLVTLTRNLLVRRARVVVGGPGAAGRAGVPPPLPRPPAAACPNHLIHPALFRTAPHRHR